MIFVAVEKPAPPKSIFEAADARIDERERFLGERRADAVRVGGAVRIVEPDDRHIRPEVVDAEREVRVDRALILRVVRRRMRGRRTQNGENLRRQAGRFRVVRMDERPAGHRVVQQIRGARRTGAHAEKLAAVRLQNFSERRRSEQFSLGALDGLQILALTGIEPACRVHRTNVDGVPEEAVRLRICAGHDRRCVHARDGRKHRVMRSEHNAALTETEQPRHHLASDVVGTEAVDHDDKLGMSRRLRGDGGGDRDRRRDSSEASKLAHAVQLRPGGDSEEGPKTRRGYGMISVASRVSKLAGSTGLEPAASAVTGQRSNQLNYDPSAWWAVQVSNLRQPACKAGALPLS